MNQKGYSSIVIMVIGVMVLALIAGYYGRRDRQTPTPLPVFLPAPLLKSEGKTPAHSISSEQVIQMKALMKKNGKSLEGFQAHRLYKDEQGYTHIRFSAYVNGVYAEETIYHFKTDGALSSISNEFDANIYSGISTVPKISEAQAIAIARSKIEKPSLVAKQVFWNKNMGMSDRAADIVLAWRVYPNSHPSPSVVIDAEKGKIIYYDSGERY